MRTNPPGDERDEGEGKKPKVVGEPGGLKKKKKQRRLRQTVIMKIIKQTKNLESCFSANKAYMNHKTENNFGRHL